MPNPPGVQLEVSNELHPPVAALLALEAKDSSRSLIRIALFNRLHTEVVSATNEQQLAKLFSKEFLHYLASELVRTLDFDKKNKIINIIFAFLKGQTPEPKLRAMVCRGIAKSLALELVKQATQLTNPNPALYLIVALGCFNLLAKLIEHMPVPQKHEIYTELVSVQGFVAALSNYTTLESMANIAIVLLTELLNRYFNAHNNLPGEWHLSNADNNVIVPIMLHMSRKGVYVQSYILRLILIDLQSSTAVNIKKKLQVYSGHGFIGCMNLHISLLGTKEIKQYANCLNILNLYELFLNDNQKLQDDMLSDDCFMRYCLLAVQSKIPLVQHTAFIVISHLVLHAKAKSLLYRLTLLKSIEVVALVHQQFAQTDNQKIAINYLKFMIALQMLDRHSNNYVCNKIAQFYFSRVMPQRYEMQNVAGKACLAQLYKILASDNNEGVLLSLKYVDHLLLNHQPHRFADMFFYFRNTQNKGFLPLIFSLCKQSHAKIAETSLAIVSKLYNYLRQQKSFNNQFGLKFITDFIDMVTIKNYKQAWVKPWVDTIHDWIIQNHNWKGCSAIKNYLWSQIKSFAPADARFDVLVFICKPEDPAKKQSVSARVVSSKPTVFRPIKGSMQPKSPAKRMRCVGSAGFSS